MKKFLAWSLAVAFLAGTAGCQYFRAEEPLPGSATTVPGEYRVGPSDVLGISIWRQPDLSLGGVPVRPDGKISIPLAGEIEVAGLTALEINEVVTERLKEYVAEPQVTIMVVQVNYPVVFIIGEVNRPGPIPIRQNTTMLQAISLAGGFTTFADRDDIHIVRREGGRNYRIPFDYEDAIKAKEGNEDLYVRPGDVIVVED